MKAICQEIMDFHQEHFFECTGKQLSDVLVPPVTTNILEEDFSQTLKEALRGSWTFPMSTFVSAQASKRFSDGKTARGSDADRVSTCSADFVRVRRGGEVDFSRTNSNGPSGNCEGGCVLHSCGRLC